MGDQHASTSKTAAAPQRQSAVPATTSRSSTSEQAHPLVHLQNTLGNQAVLRLMRAGRLQAKLAISQPGDRHELEADRVADRVLRMPTSTVQRACTDAATGGSPSPPCTSE